MRNTFTSELDFRQERDFGQKISATFEFIGAQWRPLGRVLLYLVLPAALVSSIVVGVGQIDFFSQLGSGGLGTLSALSARFGRSNLLGLLSLFLTYLLLTASLYEYVRLRMTLPPAEEVTPALVWPPVRSALPWLALASLVGIVMVMVGFLFLFFPGMYLAVALAPLFAVMIMERQGFSRALSRSFSLVSGHWWATFGLLIIMTMLQGFLGIIFQIPIYIIAGLKLLHWPLPLENVLLVVAQAIGTLGRILLYIPTMLAVLFQYFNLVEQKDGLGLHALVDSIGQAPATVRNQSYRADEEGEY